ncbi:MAG: sigma-70 family RNA polymerase sigma factor, partial [bacterium]|nr:sigma-70 family RNA polymerase sigma factor [bacterium]
MPPAPVDNLQTYFADPAKWEQATRALQSVARAIVGDQDSAEDIVQGAWVEAMQRPAKAFGLGWLRALVRSRSIDALRRKRMEPLPGEVPTDSSPEPAMWKLQAQQDVLAAVQSLKEPYRSTVFLRYFEGLGPKEIAAQSNVPEKTVKTRLTRAHAILRDRLGPGMGNKEGSWSPALIGFAALPSPTLPTATAALTPVVPLFAMKKIALIAAGLLVGLFSYSALSSKPSELGDTEPKTDAPAILAMDQGGAADLVEPPKPDRKTAALAVTEPVAKEPVGTAGTGSLRVHVARFNGSDAANVHVIARTKTDSHEYRRYYRSLANEQGVALFPGLPPGPYRLSTSRSTQSKSNAIEVLPGEQTEQSLTLAQGLRVHGQVRDSNSEAIAGASIWLTSWGLGWASGSIAAQSDAQGNYELHDVPDGQSIGASADGFHPSSLVDLDMVSNATQDRKVDLVISSGGSSLRGTVRDDAGHPIQFARIAVGNGSALPDMRLDESLRETWAPRSEQTDAKGEYSLVGLPSGNQPIQVRALGYALWNGSMDL